MLTITIPDAELYDEKSCEFIEVKGKTIQMEHSLISLSKWESKWKIPFLDGKPKTHAQTMDYYRCMTITKNVDPMLYRCIPYELGKKILDYINDPQTATTIKRHPGSGGRSREIITSELIYYWLTAFNIPFSCEQWNLNRLFMLIEICSIKNQPSKKMSAKDVARQNAALNAARRAKSGSRG